MNNPWLVVAFCGATVALLGAYTYAPALGFLTLGVIMAVMGLRGYQSGQSGTPTRKKT